MQNILNKKHKGFTLIELIVVIAIIGILVLLAMPKFMDYTRDAKEAKTQHNARVVDDAVTEYLVGNDDKLPEGLPVVTPEEIQDAIDEGTIYDPEGPVVDVPEGTYVEVETLPGMPNVDGRPISNEDGDAYIIIDKPIRAVGASTGTDTPGSPVDTPLEIVSQLPVLTVDETINLYPNGDDKALIFVFNTSTDYIVGYLGEWDYNTSTVAFNKEITIPSYYKYADAGNNYELYGESRAIRGIGDEAFAGWNTPYKSDTGIINKAIFSEGSQIQHIGDWAFSWNEITSIDIPNSVLTLGESVFEDNLLTSIDIPSSVKTIGESAFEYGTLESVTFHEGLESIGTYAFASNAISGHLSLPDTVIEIQSSAFFDNQISTMKLPNTLTRIEANSFSNNMLTSLDIPESVGYIGYGALTDNQFTSLTIPSNVKEIGDYAFAYNYQLTSLTLNDGLETIGLSAFQYGGLTTLTIPTTVSTISGASFGHNKLETVIFEGSVANKATYAFGNNGPDQNSGTISSSSPWEGTWILSGTTWAQ